MPCDVGGIALTGPRAAFPYYNTSLLWGKAILGPMSAIPPMSHGKMTRFATCKLEGALAIMTR